MAQGGITTGPGNVSPYISGLLGGASAGTAQGSITINTTQAQQAPAVMKQVATSINQAMTQVGAGTVKAEKGISQVVGAVRQLAGAFGISFGIQGVVQLGKMAIASAEAATAYNRQAVAARSLAGSQQQLNDLLQAYQEASGGAVDKATALENVTRLLATGMAHNVGDLKQFVVAIRGVAIAMGKSQEEIAQELQLAISNQSVKRLDQIGLGVAEVEQRISSLRAATAGLSREAAFQRAVLELLNQKYGELAKSQEGAKTGMEKAGASAKDVGLTFGQLIGPALNVIGEDFNRTLTRWNEGMTAFGKLSKMAVDELRKIGVLSPDLMHSSLASRTTIGRVTPQAFNVNPNQEQIDVTKLDWAKGIVQLNADTNEQLTQQNNDYQRQRADSERQFQTSTARANEDFMLQRTRQEQDLAESIARIHSDAARRETRQAEDLARNIAQATTDSADKVANARDDANKRLVELDADYEKARVKRAKDLSDKLMDAAGNLDAKQVYQIQRDAAKQEEEAKTAHDDARGKIGEQLQERLDDEAKSLAKSITQQQDAAARQLQDGRDADQQRIDDMNANAVKQRDQENADFGLRMGRMKQDHDDQMTEMDRAQGERITQIQTHAQQERDQLGVEHKAALIQLGAGNQDWIDAEKKLNDDALKLLEPLLKAGRSLLLFPNAGSNTIPFPSMVGANAPPPYTGNSSTGGSTYNSRAFNGDINVTITGSTSLSKSDVERAVADALLEVFGGAP